MNQSPLLRLRHWARGSLQRQLAIGFGSVALLTMLTMAGFLLKQQQDFLNEASIRRANALANGLAHSSASWVLANDVVGLAEILHGYRDTPDLERIFVLNRRGEVLASTKPGEAGLFVSDPISLDMLHHAPAPYVLFTGANLIDVAAPVMAGIRHVGWARIELNRNETKANLRAVAITQLEFIAITSLLMIAISIWLGRRMSARLLQLGVVAQWIADGKRSVRALAGPDDEIGRLADNVNLMLDTITRSEHDLEQLNHVYAAWTVCVATIARENREPVLLNRLCELLAEKVGFRLVFIGFTDANGDWLQIAASSNWELPYLKALKVSARGDRPEGQGPLGKTIRSGQPEILNDFLASPDTRLWHSAAQADAIRSGAAFPLARSGKIVGGIVVYSEKQSYFTRDIIVLLNGLSVDISFALDNIDRENQRRQAETELRLAASVFENSQEGIVITDAEQAIIRINSTFSKLTGFTPEEALGQTPRILASGLQDRPFYQKMWEHIETYGFWQGEIVNRRKNGDIYPEWLCITRVFDGNGHVTHYVGTFADITEHKRNEERIHKLAFYDPLTQLPNRRLLTERLRQALVESQRSQCYGAVMFMDLDRFKMLNDSQGHDLGDQLLIEAGKRIGECVREQDTVARIGGDEFVIMLKELGKDLDNVLAVAQRIGDSLLSMLRRPYTLQRSDRDNYPMPVVYHSSASIGMTLFRGSELNSENLLKQADVAMYQAKQAGRNKICVFNPEMQAHIDRRAALEAELREALHGRHFCLYYQIQVDRSGRAVGAEVLLRWWHASRGWISPAEFIPLAEETGLIDELGFWVLAESCKTLAAWAERPETCDLSLAVNVSAKQFNQRYFVEQIKNLLNDSGIDPGRLKLEITESVVLQDVEDAIATMQQLKLLGLNFSMDDFGTGYSSLSYLQRLPLSQLKIDQSFVRDIISDSSDAAIVRTILALGDSLGIDVVAEGVETPQHYAYLNANGCRYYQGYLFGKPEPLQDFERHLAERLDPD